MNDKIQYVPWLTAVFLERFFLIVDTSVLAWECCWSDVISITLAKLIDLHAEFKSSVPRKTPTIYFYRTFTGLHKAGWFWFPFQLVFFIGTSTFQIFFHKLTFIIDTYPLSNSMNCFLGELHNHVFFRKLLSTMRERLSYWARVAPNGMLSVCAQKQQVVSSRSVYVVLIMNINIIVTDKMGNYAHNYVLVSFPLA